MLDVDGVLVSGRPADGYPWFTDLEADLGIAPSWLRSHFFGAGWIDIVEGRADLLPGLQACLDLLDTDVRAEDLINYWFEMDSRIDLTVLRDCATVREQGVAVYLATNQEHSRAHYLMEDMALASHVDGIIYSAKLGATKPKAAFYEAAQAIAGYHPSQIMFIDDTLANVTGAQEAGWHARHWNQSTNLLHLLNN